MDIKSYQNNVSQNKLFENFDISPNGKSDVKQNEQIKYVNEDEEKKEEDQKVFDDSLHFLVVNGDMF